MLRKLSVNIVRSATFGQSILSNSSNFASKRYMTRLRIVFGSQSGTAEAFANDLEFDAKEKNIETELIDANEFSMQSLVSSSDQERQVTALILAVYGEGEPTDNAKKFCSELFTYKHPIAKNVNYAVFGLGNSQCFKDRFNVIGVKADATLHSLGANRIIPMMKGDASANIYAQFNEWKVQLLSELGNQDQNKPSEVGDKSTVSVPSDSTPVSTTPCSMLSSTVPQLSTRQQALAPSDRPILFGKVKSAKQLFPVTDELSSAVELTLSMKDSKPYNSSIAGTCSTAAACTADQSAGGADPRRFVTGLLAGDHIGIFPANSTHVVHRFLVSAGLSLDALDTAPLDESGSTQGTSVAATATSLRQLLTWQVQLTGVAPVTAIKLLQRWAAGTNMMPLTAKHLQNLIDMYDNNVKSKNLDIASVLDCIPKGPKFAKLPVAALLRALPPLSPRVYSLTNDPIMMASEPVGSDGPHATLLCRLLRYRDAFANSRVREGVSSSYICERLQEADDVMFFFRQSNFHLPADLLRPVIMICGGSGLAPFLSFLEARTHQLQQKQPLGPAILYYGCKSPDEYVYHERLQSYCDSGALTKLVVSFSHHNYDNSSAASSATDAHFSANEFICKGTQNITDVVVRDIDALSPLMQQQAHVYVCGGAGNFGKAVRVAVNELMLRSEKQWSEEHAQEQLGVRHLVNEKRYFEDLAD